MAERAFGGATGDAADHATVEGVVSADERYMRRALELAEAAAAAGEVPVGALVVLDGRIVGEAHNRTVAQHDPTGHAEVLALRAGAATLGTHRLDGATLYVTLEPCLMCCGALLEARIERLVFGAREPRTGAVLSAYETLMPAARRGHRVAVTEGVCAHEAAARMKAFFEARR